MLKRSIAISLTAVSMLTVMGGSASAASAAPSCDTSFDDRREWAMQEAHNQLGPKARGSDMYKLSWTLTPICGSEKVTFGKTATVPASVVGAKASGTAIPDASVPQVSSVTFDANGRALKASAARAARSFSCGNNSAAPYISPGSRLATDGWITCTSAVPLRHQPHNTRNRYPVQTVYTEGFWCCTTSTYLGNTNDMTCPTWGTKEWQGVWTGERFYGGAWAGVSASSGWPTLSC